MPSATDILVVRGYGAVGRRIAVHLAPGFPGRVAIPGRDERRAEALAESSVRGLGRAESEDAAYTDMAPRLAFWRGVEEMAAEARRTGARIILGTEPFDVPKDGSRREAHP